MDPLPTDEELRARLTQQQYHILREGGTEAPFTGAYFDEHTPGVYRCMVCKTPLFSSTNKFDSGTGWPSYDSAVADGAVKLINDTSHGMRRTEVRCGTCDSHLGHVFDDGPAETTGQRFCINSACLLLDPNMAPTDGATPAASA